MRFEIARNCSPKLPNDFAESLKLVAGVRGVLIGNWQMGRDAMDLDVWEPRNFFENTQRVPLRHAHPSHSRVDLEIDRDRSVACDATEFLGFLKSGDGRNKSALGNCRCFFR